MLEAVNSVLSNASYTRAVAEQQSVVNSYAANPARVQQASLQAPYISLYIKVDNNFDRAILQIRDNQTGDVVRQIPTESQLEAYRRAQTSNAFRPRTAEEDVPVVVSETQAQTSDVPDVPDVQPQQSSAPAPQAQTQTSSAPAPTVTSVDTSA
jgi:uncharacterized FlaG/YvyC family protein